MGSLHDIDRGDLEMRDPGLTIWIPVSLAMRCLWVDNPKEHDLGALARALTRYGYRKPCVYDINLSPVDPDMAPGAILDGNGRIEALAAMERNGSELPRGLARHRVSGVWYMEIRTGVDSPSEAVARAAAIDMNNLTLAGGDLSPFDAIRMYDASYRQIIQEQAEAGELPITVDGDIADALLKEYDYSDLDAESESHAGKEGVDVRIIVPAQYVKALKAWMANGEEVSGPGMGRGLLKRAGLIDEA
jgi:hypothetical protein